MSRTIKDTRSAKEKQRKEPADPIQQKYKAAKRNGFFTSLCEEDLCPECGGLTSFNNGFLVCMDCNWSTFETEELNFFNLNFGRAI